MTFLKAFAIMALAGSGAAILMSGMRGFGDPPSVGIGVGLLFGAAIMIIVWFLRRPSA